MSCLSSMTDQIWQGTAARDLASQSVDWYVLSDEEFERVMAGVRGTDCGGLDDARIDLYGTRINIALRQEKKTVGRLS